MYGNFSTGEFTLGGMNSNTLILAAIAAITIAVIFYNKKKHK
jgi:ABC-type glucose/galactose transport system permease subunit